jgi:hypothetical protein
MATGKRSASDYWELDGNRALLSVGALSGVFDVERPDRGLAELQFKGAPLAGGLLGIAVDAAGAKPPADNASWQPSDFYERGRDLVATYREPFGEPFNLQVYWRIVEAGDDGPLVDLIASVQTPLWEAYPAVSIGSPIEGSHVASRDALIRRLSPQLSYVEVSRPGDFELAAEEQGGRWRFDSQFMERGVIRRLHLRAGFTRSDDDAAFARRLQATLIAEAPPLTA